MEYFDQTEAELKVRGNAIPLGDKGIPGERHDIKFVKNTQSKYEHLRRYEFSSKSCSGTILDIGCGTGYGSKMLYDMNNDVYAIDNSLKAINYAKKYYPGPNYIVASAEKLPFKDESFDAVTTFEVIEHLFEPEQALSEACRILKNGGHLFISSPNPKHLRNVLWHLLLGRPYPEKVNRCNIYHVKEFSYDKFLDLIRKKGFKIKSKYGQTIPFMPTWYKISLDLARFFSRYARTIVVHAIKRSD